MEDRYLRLLEENVVLKKHAVKQDEKIKKLADETAAKLDENAQGKRVY